MQVSEIMVPDVFTLAAEDTVAKAFNLMADRSVNQVPVVDDGGKYIGMIFAKQLINSTAQPSSKLKSYIVNTSALGPDHDVEKAARLVIGSRSEEHTSELQSQSNLVCRLLLEKKNKKDT